MGSRPLGYGVPGFASGGAAATRARAAEAANAGALYTGGVNVYYADSPSFQQQAASANGSGIFSTSGPAPITAIAPFAASDNAAGQVLAPSATAGQSIVPGFIDAGAAGVRMGVPTIAFAFDRAPPDQVGVAIAARLNNLPSLHFLTAVRVDMVGGTAVLRGTVASDHDRALAGRVVMLQASVDRVLNLLVVRNPAVPAPPVPAAPIPAAPIPAAPVPAAPVPLASAPGGRA